MKKILALLFLFPVFWANAQQQTVGLFLNDSSSFDGYTLFSSNALTYLIDNCGRRVNQWQSNFSPGNSVYLLEDGSLLRTCRIGGSFTGGGAGGRLERYDWEGDLIWSFQYADENKHQHHDIAPLPNGNILVLAWEKRTRQEAIDAGRNPALTPNNGVWPEHIVEIKPLGASDAEIVWEWHLWDHLVQDFDSTRANYGVVGDHPERVDANYAAAPGGNGANWIHANAIFYSPERDQIALSSRNFNEIWVIDHSTTTQEAAGSTGGNAGKGGDLLYRWGNPAAYRRGTVADQVLFGQHDIRWIPEGYPNEGRFMVFNNGWNQPGPDASSVLVWEAPVDQDGQYLIAPDAPFGPDTVLWRYEATGFYSPIVSGSQPLPNGNILVCEGQDGRFFEVTPDKQIVWEYINPSNGNLGVVSQGQIPSNNSTFRATRYAPGFPGFSGKELAPGLPLENNPFPSNCELFTGSQPEPVTPNQAFRVWPDPFSGRWRCHNDLPVPVLCLLFDLNGRQIGEFAALPGPGILSIPPVRPGLYVLHARPENGREPMIQKIFIH